MGEKRDDDIHKAEKREERADKASASASAPPPPPRPKPAAPPPEPPLPSRLGELETAGLKKFSENVFLAPGGAIVRMDGDRVAEVVYEGKVQAERTRFGLRVRFGDLVADYSIEGLQANYHLDRQ